MARTLLRGKWQHFKRPDGLWDALCWKKGRVIGTTAGQGYANLQECLNAVESMSGSRESELVAFKDRKRSPRSK